MSFSRRAGALLLVGTMLGGSAAPACSPRRRRRPRRRPRHARACACRSCRTRPGAPEVRTIRSIAVQRQPAPRAGNDPRLRQPRARPDLHRRDARSGAQGPLRDPAVRRRRRSPARETGDLVIAVRENPVINRIILEGNKRLKDDKITPEIKLAPRQIFTRSAARADVDRILELYRRQGRFAARVEPKIVQLDQNRVDVVFEIYEGDLAKVRAINILGNNAFRRRPPAQGDVHAPGRRPARLPEVERYLRSRPARRRPAEAARLLSDPRLCRFPRRLGACRADARTAATSSSPMSSKKGRATSSARSRRTARCATSRTAKIKELVKLKPGTWFNAKAVEDAVTDLNEAAGNLGYAFADINPAYDRDAEKQRDERDVQGRARRRASMSSGSTSPATRRPATRSSAANSASTRATPSTRSRSSAARTASRASASSRRSSRSSRPKARRPTASCSAPTSRKSRPASCRCRAAIRASSGSSSSSPFRRTISWARASRSTPRSTGRAIRKSVELGFTDPYFLDKPILLGGQLFRRDYSSFNYHRQQPQHDLFAGQHRRRPAASASRHRILELRRPLQLSTTRSRSTRAPSTPTQTVPVRSTRSAIRSRRAAICATKSAPV